MLEMDGGAVDENPPAGALWLRTNKGALVKIFWTPPSGAATQWKVVSHDVDEPSVDQLVLDIDRLEWVRWGDRPFGWVDPDQTSLLGLARWLAASTTDSPDSSHGSDRLDKPGGSQ
jgi:hypothetical protein